MTQHMYTIFTVGTSEVGYGIIERDLHGVIQTPPVTEGICVSCPCGPDAWIWCKTAYIKMMRERYNILR